jgi:hypothetical protein
MRRMTSTFSSSTISPSLDLVALRIDLDVTRFQRADEGAC